MQFIALIVFRRLLWLKWEKIYIEWKAKSAQSRHCVENASVDNICSFSKTFEKWFAICSCQSKSNFHNNRLIDDQTIFFALTNNIDEWYQTITTHVDLAVLDLTLVALHKSLFTRKHLSFDIRERLKIIRKNNIVFSKNAFVSNLKYKKF